MPNYYISSSEQAHILIDVLGTDDVCMCDTEFVRRNTYYPIFSLLQVAVEEQIFLVDILALNCPETLDKIIQATSIAVFHSAQADIEILHYNCSSLPKSIFDTQIAAMMLNLNEGYSYAALVKQLCGIELDKEQRNSNWLNRPLSNEQQIYARNDVIYLSEIHQMLKQMLVEQGKFKWFEQECSYLLETKFGLGNLHLKRGRYHDEEQKGIALALLTLREQIARQENRPKTWVYSDALIYSIVKHKKISQHHSQDIKPTYIEQIEHVLSGVHTADYVDLKTIKSHAGNLKKIAQQHNIDPDFFASYRDIEELLASDSGKIKNTWRWDLMQNIG